MGLFTNTPIGAYLEKVESRINEDAIWVKIVDSEEIKSIIIYLNTEKQLFEKGVNSEGVSLKEIGGNDFTDSGYSPVTIEIKKRKGGKGGKISNITLYDTGDYYESHKVKVTKKGFEITADPQKSDGNLFVDWGKEIVGLTDESLQTLINELLIDYISYTRNVIFKR